MRNSLLLLFSFVTITASAQEASILGLVMSETGKPVPFATVLLEGTPWGTTTDLGGNYALGDLPAGKYEVQVKAIGYKRAQQTVQVAADTLVTMDFILQESHATLHEVVVTGTRTERRRLESPVAVNVLDSRTFGFTQSNTLSEGLCFQPGLRMETDCQTCNYTQLRINGLGGSYSQVLVNSRPIFISLMSLYGLEQLPANMVERVEVVRGGGSVLYGSSAIAGTVNIITKEPTESTYTLSTNSAVIDGAAWDHILNANVNTVNEEQHAGFSFFASHRNREAFDANGDGFSELTQLHNNSFGFNTFFKPTDRDKVEVNG
ncbi:TonB-dependent receptor [Pontibacter kalidii]|uniref:TonB-dependent receptor n=1 Tax=Pontibacter kalidii TaxID=2592049 RepID=UPI002255006D|nr:carboxypeptidase-like regulatory domain-containing protein [Pontibacter kalidii]